ncbi:MAG: ATP-binding protein [candidate division WOR-3 bacterium]
MNSQKSMDLDSKKSIINSYIDKCYELVRIHERLVRLSRQEGRWFPFGGSDLDINDTSVNKTFRETLKEKARIEKELKKIIRQAKAQGLTLPFEEIAQKYNLSPSAKLLLMVVFYHGTLDSRDEEVVCGRIFEVLATKPSENLELRRIINQFLETELLEEASDDSWLLTSRSRRAELLSNLQVRLGPKVLEILKPALDLNFINPRGSKKIFNELRMKPKAHKILSIREPQLSFDQIVHPEERLQMLNRIIFDIKYGNEKLLKWGFDKTIKYGKGVVVLFYGPPGTGKTATAEAIACETKKKLGVVNYAQLLNYYVGESEKNLMKVFNEARDENCILLFDEADSLFACRLTESRSVDRMHNYMTNILMQELERFDGVVILTTNREYAFDEAFPRRILYKIKFDIPGPAERARIWRALIPPEAPLAPDVDFNLLAEKYALTGGEIKNAILKAVKDSIYLGNECITMELLSKHAQAELENVNRKTKKSVGFKAE